jgi:hypothetical protein
MERRLATHIGDEIGVVVHFDYQALESATRDYPGIDSDVTINAVCINGNDDNDILAVLNAEIIESIKLECFEKMER